MSWRNLRGFGGLPVVQMLPSRLNARGRLDHRHRARTSYNAVRSRPRSHIRSGVLACPVEIELSRAAHSSPRTSILIFSVRSTSEPRSEQNELLRRGARHHATLLISVSFLFFSYLASSPSLTSTIHSRTPRGRRHYTNLRLCI